MAHPKPTIYSDFSDCPDFLKDFITYQRTIKGLSPRSVEAYYTDLKLFLRYVYQKRFEKIDNELIDSIDISKIDFELVKSVKQSDILDFMYFVMDARGNSVNARSRKLSSLRGFFKYLTKKVNLLQDNPCENIELPANKKRLPKYLSLEQSIELLRSTDTDFRSRDYCIIMLFLSCGMRLSELVGIDVLDLQKDKIRIIGKGNKERTVYLNDGCISAIEDYMTERNKIVSPEVEPAMFVSKRTKKRISPRRVEQIVTDCLQKAGLSGQGFSTHKLRHTAATLLYRSGNADMLALKEILGHEHVSTTEIYTHISDEAIEKAAKGSPLATFKKAKNPQKAAVDAMNCSDKDDDLSD